MSNPFGSASKRFIKFAEKKIQKGINYLEAQANPAQLNSNYLDNPDPYNTPSPVYDTSSSAYNTSINLPYPNPQTFDSAPPPPAPFSEAFPQSQTSQTPNSTFNPPPTNSPNAKLLKSAGPIVTQELLFQMQARLPSACKSLGPNTVTEARKGLSRVLTPTRDDIELFGTQLKNSDDNAIEPNWNTLDDQLPCFALSYVQHPPDGCYKFSDQQWQNFHCAVEAIAHAGVKQFRVWLDQCLRLRDASRASWAHIGILPYILWPVIALGAKLPGAERTTDSFERMWPFVEQVSALWGMGLIIASEHRSRDLSAGVRTWLSYNLRVRTEPEQDLAIVLLNVFHGATDSLETGWKDDVRELKEMASANVMYANEQLIVGSDWKDRFASVQPLSSYTVVGNIKMSCHNEYLGGVNIYLDGSRALKCTSWNGIREWMSGNEGAVNSSEHDVTMIEIGMDKYNLITDIGEYQLLHIGAVTTTLWLLVAMAGRSSNFSRGRVAWTKILTGLASCSLAEMFEHGDMNGVHRVLREQLRNPSVRILSAKKVDTAIEWM